jgi:hypothetical protein
MPFDSIVSRSDAASTIPEEIAADVIKAATEQSAALSLFRRVNMGSALQKLPVLSALAQAYWVAGDTGLKQTTEMAWAGVNLVAEELAAIVPVPENVISDSAINVWSEVREGLAEAVAIALDQAVFQGLNKPASWPAAVVPAAIAAGNTAEQGTATTAQGGIVGDVDTALDAVEADGFDPTGIAAKRSLRGLLRRARDSQGQRLADVGGDTIEGVPVSYVAGGVFDAPTTAAIEAGEEGERLAVLLSQAASRTVSAGEARGVHRYVRCCLGCRARLRALRAVQCPTTTAGTQPGIRRSYDFGGVAVHDLSPSPRARQSARRVLGGRQSAGPASARGRLGDLFPDARPGARAVRGRFGQMAWKAFCSSSRA